MPQILLEGQEKTELSLWRKNHHQKNVAVTLHSASQGVIVMGLRAEQAVF